MPSEDSARKKFLDAGLKTLLATLELPKWLKAPATFVAELSSRFRDLPAEQKSSLELASIPELTDALFQLDLATRHAACSAAGVARVEDQVAVLKLAIEQASAPKIIKFPRTIKQDVSGDGNFVVGEGSIHIGTVDMRSTAKRRRTSVLPGTVATDPYKVGYLQYLADRFNEFKEWEVGKNAMKYALIRIAYKREMKFPIAHTPLDQFERAVVFLQRRIHGTKLGRIKKAEGNRLFETFDQFCARGEATVVVGLDAT